MRKINYKNITVYSMLAVVLLTCNFILMQSQSVQAKTYNASGEWTKVEENGTEWYLSISMFTSPESEKLVGNCTFSCLANLGPRFSQVLYVNGDVYKMSANKYKCKFSDPYSGEVGTFIIKLTSNKRLKLIKTKTTERITSANPSGKYKLTKRYIS